jgi:hypothetical protein
MSHSVREVATQSDFLATLGPAAADSRAVILIGGADFTEAGRLAELGTFFETLAAFCERTGTTVVDGGTHSGVMRLIAEARSRLDVEFPLIGVAPVGAFDRSSRDGRTIEVARDHSMVILVPGSEFGDESAWLFAAGDHFAGGSAPTIVVNGGALTLEEARTRLGQGHPVIVVAGSGRAADELAADEGLRASGRLRVIPLTVDDAGLEASISGDAPNGAEATERWTEERGMEP